MNREDLERLIGQGESLTLEFKTGAIADDEIVEAVVCLANAEGGKLILGVGDDGTADGYRPAKPTTPDRLAAMVVNRTNPSAQVEVAFVDFGGFDVAVVDVRPAESVVATTSGKYLRRAITVSGEPECMPMAPSQVLSRASAGGQDYAATPIPGVRVDDLDRSEIDRMRRLAGDDGGDDVLSRLSDVDLIKALRLSDGDNLTIGAVLLFGTPELIARKVPTHEVSFQVLEALEVRVNYIERLPLLRAMEELHSRISAYNPEEEIEIGLFRVGLPRFAEAAVRELVANALVHRDYTAMGTVSVQIDAEALVVSNPGGFPIGITTKNVLVAAPTPRNPLLADAFKRAGLVERTGRGVNRAFESQLAIGRPAPDYGRSTSSRIVARVRSGPADRELAGYIAEMQRSGSPLSLQDLLALHEVRVERVINARRASELFQVSIDEARAELNRLVEGGLLEPRGTGSGRTYHLAASVYRRLGEAGSYVRTRGFDDVQQEQMVLSYVSSHGVITRREAAELCQLDSDQASRLLRRMRDNGALKLEGAKRAARYTLP